MFKQLRIIGTSITIWMLAKTDFQKYLDKQLKAHVPDDGKVPSDPIEFRRVFWKIYMKAQADVLNSL